MKQRPRAYSLTFIPFINKKQKIVSLAVRRFFAFAARRFGGGASPPLQRRQSRPSWERSDPFPSEAEPTFRRGAERAFSFGGCADVSSGSGASPFARATRVNERSELILISISISISISNSIYISNSISTSISYPLYSLPLPFSKRVFAL